MKHKLLSFVLFFSCNILVHAQALTPLNRIIALLQPADVFPTEPGKSFLLTDRSKGEKPASFLNSIGDGSVPVFAAEMPVAGKSSGDAQVIWKNEKPVKKGDALLARFVIRAIYARQESGEAVVNFFVNQNVAPNERQVIIELSIGPEWKTVDIPFEANKEMAVGEATIGFQFGALAQKLELAHIQLLNFEKSINVPSLPTTRFSYAGQEKDATWRIAAMKRIEEIRTAPISVAVTNAKGKPVKGAIVHIVLAEPAFIFGTAVSVNLINANDSNGVIYRSRVKELFNTVTIDNNLKWSGWIDPVKRVQTKTAIAWINNNGLRLRGHNLVWPGKKFTPSFYAKQPGFGPGFADSITKHIEDIATYTKGKVIAWDVINEMMHEKDYFEVMPRSKAIEWFQQAHRIDPNAQMFINEYSMLNSIASPKNINTYLELIAELRNSGAPIQGIGVQGHVGRQPRNPAQVLTDLDLFIPTGLPVQITEFDVNSPDEALQADYTRDFLIACYSHPVVTGFTMWGFWEAAHWKPDAAMYRKNWSAKPNAEVWREWVTNKWKTNLTVTTGRNGKVDARGHFGHYQITVTKNGVTKKVMYHLSKNAKPIEIKL